MKKSTKLVKRRNVVKILREKGIKQIGTGSLEEIDKFLDRELKDLIDLMNVMRAIKGKKMLEKTDVLECIKKLKNVDRDSYEI